MKRNKDKIPNVNLNRESLKVRLILVSVLFVLFGVGLVGRLFFLQVVKHEELVSKSMQQHQVTVNVQYGRGFIYDRNMNELASNIKVESVYVTPQEIKDKKKTALLLAKNEIGLREPTSGQIVTVFLKK